MLIERKTNRIAPSPLASIGGGEIIKYFLGGYKISRLSSCKKKTTH